MTYLVFRFTKMLRSHFLTLAIAALATSNFACSSLYYGFWEQLGKEKRDLLKDNVEKASVEQKEASEQFKDTLSRLRSMYGLPESQLQKTYDQVSADYDASKKKAEQLQERIAKVENIANDLFKEWDQEIGEISRESLREDSRRKLDRTKRRYTDMHAAMKAAEKSMDPVLVGFHDQVLFLKHNLNAQAIGALGKESKAIEKDIAELLLRMEESTKKADAFAKALPKN